MGMTGYKCHVRTDLSGVASSHNAVVVEKQEGVGVSSVSLAEDFKLVVEVTKLLLKPKSVQILVVHIPVLHPENGARR